MAELVEPAADAQRLMPVVSVAGVAEELLVEVVLQVELVPEQGRHRREIEACSSV